VAVIIESELILLTVFKASMASHIFAHTHKPDDIHCVSIKRLTFNWSKLRCSSADSDTFRR